MGLHDSWGGGACVSRAFGDIQGERWVLRRPPAEGPGAQAARGSGAAWSGQELTASGHTSLGPGQAGRLSFERPQPGRVGVSLPRRAGRAGWAGGAQTSQQLPPCSCSSRGLELLALGKEQDLVTLGSQLCCT